MTTQFACYLARPADFDAVTGKGWQITIDPATHITDAQIKPTWSKLIGKRRYLINVRITGVPDVRTGKALNALIRKLTDRHKAVVVDLQTHEAWTKTQRVQLRA